MQGNQQRLGLHAPSAVATSHAIDSQALFSEGLCGTIHDPGQRRRDRLHRKAAAIFADKVERTLPDGRTAPHFKFRLAMCLRGTDGGEVGIYRNAKRDKATYHGLQTCGSPWTCPTCAPKIAALRVKEINHAIELWTKGHKGERGEVYFVTLTNQHDMNTAGAGLCTERMKLFSEALSYFKGLKAYKRWRAQCGYKGAVRGLEPTYGEQHGWHIHTHEILFAADAMLVFNRKGDAVRWLSPAWKIAKQWARVLIKFNMAGLNPKDTGIERFKKLRHLLTRCYDIKPGAYAAEYLAEFGKEPESQRGRWGMASEVAKSHLKVARGVDNDLPRRCSHASPFELLNDCLDGDRRSGELFREFGEAFHGRARLYWSPKLKDFFDIAELEDSEAAGAKEDACDEFVCNVTPDQWRKVIAYDKRFELRCVAALHGAAGVSVFLLALGQGAPPTHSGTFTEYGHIASQRRRHVHDMMDSLGIAALGAYGKAAA